jgi:hypothetical protein
MDILFEEGLDEAQFQGNPHLYDYYLFLLLDKTNNEFKMSFDSNQEPHFSYSGTFNVINDKLTFYFTKSHPLYIYCEEDLLNITDINFEHTVTFSVKSEKVSHAHPYEPTNSYRTIIFNISPFIHEDRKKGNTILPPKDDKMPLLTNSSELGNTILPPKDDKMPLLTNSSELGNTTYVVDENLPNKLYVMRD